MTLLDTVVPGWVFSSETRRALDSANTVYIVERADEKRFVPRNPIGGYEALLRVISARKEGNHEEQTRRIEVLLVNGTCSGWQSLLHAAGWTVPAAGTPQEAAGVGAGCEEDAAGSRGGASRRAAAFGAFVRHLVCREAAFPAATVFRDVPAAVARDLPPAEVQLLASLSGAAGHTTC
jgi:hypothetical protein